VLSINLILKLIRRVHFYFFILLLNSNPSFGQSEIQSNPSNATIGIVYLSIPYSVYDSESMSPQGVGNGVGWCSLGFDAVFYDFLLLGTEIGWDNPSDEAEFTNNTDSGEMTSGVSVWQYSLLGGIKIPDVYLSASSRSYIFGNINFGNM